jgi:hypothetical protein
MTNGEEYPSECNFHVCSAPEDYRGGDFEGVGFVEVEKERPLGVAAGGPFAFREWPWLFNGVVFKRGFHIAPGMGLFNQVFESD